jgi:ribosomal 50S subunit-associated protein YjgA (DUF615 family)
MVQMMRPTVQKHNAENAAVNRNFELSPISALFLVLLIAPFAFAQSDIIEMIQKSEEGKEVLDNVYIQTSLNTEGFNVKHVSSALKAMDRYIRKSLKDDAALAKRLAGQCRANVRSTGGRFHDMTVRAVAIKRHLDRTNRHQNLRSLALKRANEELSQYSRFYTMTHHNSQAWTKFWKRSQKNVRSVANLMAQVGSQVKRVHRSAQKAAFVQLPEYYTASLTEIRTQFENTFDNFDGLRPVMADLLEIASEAKHMTNSVARLRVRSLIRHILVRLHDQLNHFEEEHSAQTAMFAALENLFEDALQRGQKVAGALLASSKYANRKVKWLTQAVAGSDTLASDARTIVDLVVRECAHVKHAMGRAHDRNVNVLSVISQVEEVVADRWGSLHGYFLQKMQTALDRD